jgi:hypothetical protein
VLAGTSKQEAKTKWIEYISDIMVQFMPKYFMSVGDWTARVKY